MNQEKSTGLEAGVGFNKYPNNELAAALVEIERLRRLIPTQDESLLGAIKGDRNKMSHRDLVLTCQMLERGRAAWRKESEALRATLVMLKRELDSHVNDPLKYEFPRAVWDEVVRRHGGEK